MALGHASDALDAFEYVVDRQANDWDHPRISGVRGKAAALVALGKAEAAQPWFERCRTVAEADHLRWILREVAVMAVGDVIAREGDAAKPALWALWTRFFPDYAAPARILWRVRTSIY